MKIRIKEISRDGKSGGAVWKELLGKYRILTGFDARNQRGGSISTVGEVIRGYVYKIKVKPQTNTLKVGHKDMPISPGMTAQAEVKTGTRRIIEFFLPGVEAVKDGFELR